MEADIPSELDRSDYLGRSGIGSEDTSELNDTLILFGVGYCGSFGEGCSAVPKVRRVLIVQRADLALGVAVYLQGVACIGLF